MGLTDDVSLTGPNADLMNHLKTHMTSILVPGVCIDTETGGWNLSSSSSTTWESKVYLNQFVAENVLGLKNDATGQTADSAQYAYQVLVVRRSAGPTSSSPARIWRMAAGTIRAV